MSTSYSQSTMRTILTLDDDVAALVDAERRRTGETLRRVVNRLIRRGLLAETAPAQRPLPTLPGRPLVDVTDAFALLASLDDGRRRECGVL